MAEPRLAQETLRESEQMARGIIDTALDAFVQMDERGTVADGNSQAEKIFGWSRSEAIGAKLSELSIPEIHRSSHKSGLEHFLRTGAGPILGRRFEIEALRRDRREIKVELSVTELRRRDGFVTLSSTLISLLSRPSASISKRRPRIDRQTTPLTSNHH